MLVIMIAADVGGRDTERERDEKPRATSKSVPAISARDHHTITQHQRKTLPFSCPFTPHFSAADADSIGSAPSRYFHRLGRLSGAAHAHLCVLNAEFRRALHYVNALAISLVILVSE